MKGLRLAPDLILPIEAVTEFWSRAEMDGECLTWRATLYKNGYGRIWVAVLKRDVGAHQLAFFLANGYLPAVVRHRCDNKPCILPAHLLPGTHALNAADRVERNRTARGLRNGMNTKPQRRPHGEAHGMHKLTAADVAEIRRTYRPRNPSRQALAARFNVSKNTIDRVLSGAWGRLTPVEVTESLYEGAAS